jgi:hypothetical protein
MSRPDACKVRSASVSGELAYLGSLLVMNAVHVTWCRERLSMVRPAPVVAANKESKWGPDLSTAGSMLGQLVSLSWKRVWQRVP